MEARKKEHKIFQRLRKSIKLSGFYRWQKYSAGMKENNMVKEKTKRILGYKNKSIKA